MIRSGVPGKLGRIRLKGAALEKLRRDCFVRDKYICVDCGCGVEWSGWNAGHMAHIVSRGAGGSDTLDNVRTKCFMCHFNEHNPKAVPRKKIEPIAVNLAEKLRSIPEVKEMIEDLLLHKPGREFPTKRGGHNEQT